MTAIIARPGVNNSTRYMIGDNLVFFHHFGEFQANWDPKSGEFRVKNPGPRFTIAYFFPEDNVMMMAVSSRVAKDPYDRHVGNDIAFDRLLDLLRKPDDEEVRRFTSTVKYEDKFKGLIHSLYGRTFEYAVSSALRDNLIEAAMEGTIVRYFRSTSHRMIRDFIENEFLSGSIMKEAVHNR